jgi:hypothetical protein
VEEDGTNLVEERALAMKVWKKFGNFFDKIEKKIA